MRAFDGEELSGDQNAGAGMVDVEAHGSPDPGFDGDGDTSVRTRTHPVRQRFWIQPLVEHHAWRRGHDALYACHGSVGHRRNPSSLRSPTITSSPGAHAA